MKRIRVSQNIYLDELVDVVTYTSEPDNGLSKINPILVDVLQLFRSITNKPIIINNWWKYWLEKKEYLTPKQFYNWVDNKSGIYQSSGYRAPFCKIGAKKSVHRTGGAGDLKGNQNEMYKIVEDNALLFYNTGLRRIEDPKITNGWLHMDVSELNHVPGKIRIVDRTKHVNDIEVWE